MPYADVREFMGRLESAGQLRRITRQVDWDLELSHVSKLNEERRGGFALLFENVKDHPGMSVLTSCFTTKERLALALGMPTDLRFTDLANEWMKRIRTTRVAPRWTDTAPCKERVLKGSQANLNLFPSPRFNVKDGGRYIGTAGVLVTRNRDTGRINLGIYRVMVIDGRNAGIYLIKGKDAEIDLRGYAQRNEPMPVALVIGCDPTLCLCAGTLFPFDESEYEIAGALRGEPVKVVSGETVDLPVPATAEIVIEGEIIPGERLPEGPFGEFTGYYSGTGEPPQACIRVKAITHRADPIFLASVVGKPVTDTNMILAISHTVSLWNDLTGMGIPGIQAVYGPPVGAGRQIAVISVKQMYPGHAMQVGLAAVSTVTGNFGLKTVIVVDDDIDPENWEEVLFALSYRFQPSRGTQILHRGRSTPLDPSLPFSDRFLTSRVILDCTIPYEWENKPEAITLDQALVKTIQSRWEEYLGG